MRVAVPAILLALALSPLAAATVEDLNGTWGPDPAWVDEQIAKHAKQSPDADPGQAAMMRSFLSGMTYTVGKDGMAMSSMGQTRPVVDPVVSVVDPTHFMLDGKDRDGKAKKMEIEWLSADKIKMTDRSADARPGQESLVMVRKPAGSAPQAAPAPVDPMAAAQKAMADRAAAKAAKEAGKAVEPAK